MNATKHTPGCIDWPGALDRDGYGRTGSWKMAHRVSYEKNRGQIPPGMVIDHLYRNRRCVNPAHLEVVTPYENNRRGIGVTATNARKSFCIAGHPLSGDNLRTRPNGRRECKECGRVRWRACRARRIAKAEGRS